MGGDLKAANDLYLGQWQLVPELSLYQFGPLPAACTYLIQEDARGIRVSMRWQLQSDGPESTMEFGGPADGSRHTLPGDLDASATTTFSITRIDPHTLDSAAFRGDERFAYARRVASHDGSLLAIVQEGLLPDGGSFRNFQVYRRMG